MPAVKPISAPAASPPPAEKPPEVDQTAFAVNRLAASSAQVAAQVAANTQAQARLAESMKEAIQSALQNHPAPAKELDIRFVRDPITDRLAGMKVIIIR